MQADIFDAVNVNTRATGNWGKKAPTFPVWPRPDTKPNQTEAKPVSVSDLYNKFTRR